VEQAKHPVYRENTSKKVTHNVANVNEAYTQQYTDNNNVVGDHRMRSGN